MSSKKITKDTPIKEILNSPQGRKILEKFNFPCLNCPFAFSELENLKIGEVCQLYGLDLKKLLKELNLSKKKENQ